MHFVKKGLQNFLLFIFLPYSAWIPGSPSSVPVIICWLPPQRNFKFLEWFVCVWIHACVCVCVFVYVCVCVLAKTGGGPNHMCVTSAHGSVFLAVTIALLVLFTDFGFLGNEWLFRHESDDACVIFCHGTGIKSQAMTVTDKQQSGSTHNRKKRFYISVVCRSERGKCCWQPAVWAVAPWRAVVFCGRQPSDLIVSDCTGEMERRQISVCFTDAQPNWAKVSIFIFKC